MLFHSQRFPREASASAPSHLWLKAAAAAISSPFATVARDQVAAVAGPAALPQLAARGFRWLVDRGRLPTSPRIHCVQSEGNDTIAGPLREGSSRARKLVCRTAISGLQVPSVIDCDAASGSSPDRHDPPDKVIGRGADRCRRSPIGGRRP